MSYSNKINRSGRLIMDLSFVGWKNVYRLVCVSLLFGAIIILSACVTSPAVEQQATVVPPVENEPEPIPVEPLPLTPELVYYILMAELAGQRGEIGVAAELYNKAAHSIDSLALASRSAQVANFTRDKARINRALTRWLEVDPDNAEIYILQAPFFMMQGDYDTVISSVDKALNLAPEKSAQFLTQIADNLSEIAKAEQALSVVGKLELYQQQNPEAVFVYARLAEYYKHYTEALEAVNIVLEQNSDREDAHVLKAEILQRLGKGEEALAILKAVVAKETASDEVRFSYAKLLGENNKIVQARKIFEQLHSKLPDNEEILFALGLLALEDKNGEQAKHYFSRLVELGDAGKQASYFMGLAEELNKNNDAALIWFASVPADSSRFQAAQSRYVNLLADNGQLDKARLHLKLLRKEQPEREVQYYLFEASFLREQSQNQEAFDLYSEALKGYPNNVELLYGRAMTAESLHRLSVLESDLRKILEFNPDNHVVLNALGYTLADRTNKYQEALVLIQKALSLKPDDPMYLDSLGWVLYRLGNFDDAVRYLKQAMALEDEVEFFAHLGEVLWQQGHHAEAKQIWQQGVALDKDSDVLIDTMRRFGE
ncbi:MAG: tetratricopeptide repeat protein [Methylophaga sp.]|nr:tetratricopeptide repeat protein [Methylophaga sp.]